MKRILFVSAFFLTSCGTQHCVVTHGREPMIYCPATNASSGAKIRAQVFEAELADQFQLSPHHR